MLKITTLRMLLSLSALLACSVEFLAPLTAEVASEITGITVSPSPAVRGGAVTIVVTGKGDPCASIDLDFGDGMPHATLSGAFPRPTTHAYNRTGTMTLRARGIKGCTGNVSKTLTVSATSPDPSERPRPPIVPPPAAIPPVQVPKPQIETETTRRLAALPIIEEFRAIAPPCQLADPNRPVLAFRAANKIAHVQISAATTYRDTRGTVLYPVYDRSAEPGRPWPSLTESGIRDSRELYMIEMVEAYVLTVTGANGQKVSRRVNFSYRYRPSIFELLSPVTESRDGDSYIYSVQVQAERINIDMSRIGARFWHIGGGGRLTEAMPTFSHGFSASLMGAHYTIRMWTSHNANQYGPATFIYRAVTYRNACGGGETIERTAVLPAESTPPPPPPPPPTPPAPSADLPDLVPVIDPHDGAGLTFRIENRGRAAATAFSVSIQCDGCVGTTPNPSGFDRTERIEPGGSWFSPLVSIGARAPDRALIRASEWVQVSVSTPNRESDTGNNRARRDRGR